MTLAKMVAALATTALLAATAGCTVDPPADEPIAGALVTIDCPTDIADLVVGGLDCARLAVPENRRRPDSPLIQIMITTVRAPSGSPDREPVLVTGSATQHNYAGIAPLAQRVRRDVILVDTRGTGHSMPNLSCPEVSATAPQVWSTPHSADDKLQNAIASCHTRLTSAGIDVAAYDLVEAAADLEDLRVALGVRTWNVAAYGGGGSRVAFELLGQAPGPIRAVVVDSPDVPGTDPRVVAGTATESAVRDVLDGCARDARCRMRYPEPKALLDEAMASVSARPVQLSIDRDGQDVAVVLDAGLLARALRQVLSDGGSSGPLFTAGSIPSLLSAVTRRRERDLSAWFTQLLRYQDPLCLGYRTPCLPIAPVALGVELSTLCRDIAPFTAAPRPRLGPGFRDAYGDDSLWWRVCDSWPVDPADEAVARPPVSDVPTLVALGRFPPYSPEPEVRRGLAGLTSVSYVIDPERPHNVLPRACANRVRNQWIDDPTPFPHNPCPKEMPISWT